MNPAAVVEVMRLALEERRYSDFVAQFAEDGTYELPFALPGTPNRSAGIADIRARFEAIAQSPATKLIEVISVAANVIESTDPNVLTVELRTKGKARTSGEAFEVQSSIAVIRFENGKVKQYRDYPNSIGIAKAAGVLSQFAASLR